MAAVRVVTLVTADMAHEALVAVTVAQPKQVRAVVAAVERVDLPLPQVLVAVAVSVSMAKVLMDMQGITVLLLAAAAAPVGAMVAMAEHIPAAPAALMVVVDRLLGDVAAALRVALEQSVLFGPEILVHSHQLVQVTHNEPVYRNRKRRSEESSCV